MMRTKFSFLILLLGSLASARNYNYQDIPVGERAFGMGSTSLAVEADTGNMFTNPGVLALSPHSQFSASLSAFSRIDTHTGQYVSLFESAQQNIKRTGFLAVPAMVGGHVKYEKWVWGGTILIPFSFESSGILNVDSTHVASYESKDESYWYGMFLARVLSPKHSVGVSIFYVSRSNYEKFTFNNTDSPVQIRLIDESFGASGFVAVMGGTYKISDDILLGYSFRTPVLLLGGSGAILDATSGSSGVANTNYSTSFYPMPMRFSVGASWHVSPRVLLAADLNFYTGIHGNFENSNMSQFNISAKPIGNLAVGVEYMRWDEVGFRLGALTNFSSAQDTPTGLSAINDKVNMFGGTAAVVFSKSSGTISLGGYVQVGEGSAAEISENPTAIVPRSNYLYGFVVGSSKKF